MIGFVVGVNEFPHVSLDLIGGDVSFKYGERHFLNNIVAHVARQVGSNGDANPSDQLLTGFGVKDSRCSHCGPLQLGQRSFLD